MLQAIGKHPALAFPPLARVCAEPDGIDYKTRGASYRFLLLNRVAVRRRGAGRRCNAKSGTHHPVQRWKIFRVMNRWQGRAVSRGMIEQELAEVRVRQVPVHKSLDPGLCPL
jgi:hypothetical protein